MQRDDTMEDFYDFILSILSKLIFVLTSNVKLMESQDGGQHQANDVGCSLSLDKLVCLFPPVCAL